MVPKLSQIVPSGPNWSQMVQNGLKWSQMVPHGPKWAKTIPNIFKMSSMVACSKFQIIPNGPFEHNVTLCIHVYLLGCFEMSSGFLETKNNRNLLINFLCVFFCTKVILFYTKISMNCNEARQTKR